MPLLGPQHFAQAQLSYYYRIAVSEGGALQPFPDADNCAADFRLEEEKGLPDPGLFPADSPLWDERHKILYCKQVASKLAGAEASGEEAP